MTEASDARGVLIMAVQDLYDGECRLIDRLPRIRKAVEDDEFATEIDRDRARSGEQRDRLQALATALGIEAQAEPNVWLRAILKDARNDIASIAKGTWRDVALVGALRKAKQAERVSYETAIALAQREGLGEHAAALIRSRDEEAHADASLAAILARLTRNG